jgi:hypothetical protein
MTIRAEAQDVLLESTEGALWVEEQVLVLQA